MGKSRKEHIVSEATINIIKELAGFYRIPQGVAFGSYLRKCLGREDLTKTENYEYFKQIMEVRVKSLKAHGI